jgi:hypothetical protein
MTWRRQTTYITVRGGSDLEAVRRDIEAVTRDCRAVFGTQPGWEIVTTGPAPARRVECAYCGRQRPEGRESCAGCGAAEVRG